MLGISTKRYMSSGEITGYAEKVSGMARAAKLIKNGTSIGTALTVASSGLEIRNACALGREEQCTRAKYVEGSSLFGSLAGGAAGGHLGGFAAIHGCAVVLGVATGGTGALLCGVVGGAIGGVIGGKLGDGIGETLGELMYGEPMR